MIRWAAYRGHPSSVLTRDVEAEVPGLIRWFTWHRGEKDGSWVNHYVYLFLDLERIIEALAGGVVKRTLEAYEQSETTWGVIVEHLGFTTREHLKADEEALALEGSPYNYAAIAKQALDGLFGKILGHEVDWFRRIRLPWIVAVICSQAGVRIHKAAGWVFMGLMGQNYVEQRGSRLRLKRRYILAPLPERRAAPDCIFDDVFRHRPDNYAVRGEINPELRPEGLPEFVVRKIEGDLKRAPVSSSEPPGEQ